MKKWGLIGSLVLLTALILAACQKKDAQGEPADPNAPVRLLVWCWDPQFNVFAMKEAEKIYRRDHPNVTLDVQDISSLEQKLITALSANDTSTLPDIVLMQDNSMKKFVSNFPRAFLPVNGKVDLSQFAQFKLDMGTLNGQSYGVPFDNGATAFFLRSDIIEKAGLKVSDFNDITWEEFIRLGRIVKEKAGVALISMLPGADIIQLQLQSAGAWTFDDQGKAFIQGNPVVKEIVILYKQLVDSGVALEVPGWNEYIATLGNGAVAGTIQGCWIIGNITPAQDLSGKWAMVNTPRLNNIPGATNYSSQGGSGWMVMAHTKKADAAFDLLNKTFAGSEELYATILPPSGAIATWLPAAKSPVYSEPQPYFGGQKIYEQLLDYASKIPNVKYGLYNYEARDAIGRAMLNVVNGSDVDAEIANAQKELVFLMDQ